MSDEHDAIAAVIAAQCEAWDRGDAEGFAAAVTDDVVFTNVVGMFSVGRAAFVAQHARIFGTIYKGSTNHQEIERITMVRPDVAVVNTLSRARGFVSPPPGIVPIDGAIHARLEQVMVRNDGRWQVAAFHNVVVAAPFVPGAPPPA